MCTIIILISMENACLFFNQFAFLHYFFLICAHSGSSQRPVMKMLSGQGDPAHNFIDHLSLWRSHLVWW
jgi:hypothetical protein